LKGEYQMRIKILEDDQLEKMYYKEYLPADEIDKFYIRETLALNLTGGYKHGYVEVMKLLKPEELKRLLGVCAARYKRKINNDTYANVLARFKIRIMRLLENV